MEYYREDCITRLIDHPNVPTNLDTDGLRSVADSKSVDVENVIESVILLGLVLREHCVQHMQISLQSLYIAGDVVRLYHWDRAYLNVGYKISNYDTDLTAIKKCIKELLDTHECKYSQAYRVALEMPTIGKMAEVCDIPAYTPIKIARTWYYNELTVYENKLASKFFNKYASWDVDSTLRFIGYLRDVNSPDIKMIENYYASRDDIISPREKIIRRCLGYRPVGHLKLAAPVLDQKLTQSVFDDLTSAAQFLITNYINHGAFTLDNFRLIDGHYRLVNFDKAVFGVQDIKQIQAVIPDFKYKPEPTIKFVCDLEPHKQEQFEENLKGFRGLSNFMLRLFSSTMMKRMIDKKRTGQFLRYLRGEDTMDGLNVGEFL